MTNDKRIPTIKETIQSFLNQNPSPSGRQTHSFSQSFESNQGDESSIQILILKQWVTESDYQDEDDFYEQIGNQETDILNLIEIDKQFEFTQAGLNWVITQDTGLIKEFKSDNGDSIKIQSTDATIYITILFSGQY